MDFKEAELLAKAWGDKPCNHPHVEKETWINPDGVPTHNGDYVCTQCGYSMNQQEYEEYKKSKK
jgi:hypothetical protein